MSDVPHGTPGGTPAGGASRALPGLLLAAFLLLGLTWGAQGVLWPDVMAVLGIGKGAFGLAQLAPPLVAVAFLVRGGPLSARWGKRRLTVASLLAMGAGALALAGAVHPATGAGLAHLVCALALTGIGFGLFEIAVNGAALDWEGVSGRAVLNGLHGGYSAGAAAGAAGAGVLLGLGWRPDGVFLLLALLSAALAGATLAFVFPPASPPLPLAATPDAPGAEPVWPAGPAGPAGRLFLGPLLPVALAAALGSVGESVANLWSVIYLAELGAGSVLGGAVFALTNLAMLAGRLGNAAVVAHLGPFASLGLSGAGLVLAAAVLLLPGGGVPLAMAGFAVLGLAVAGVIPTALTAAARIAPGHSGAIAGGVLASVYLAFVAAPPLVGWLAEHFSLQAALLVVGVSGLGILALTLVRRKD